MILKCTLVLVIFVIGSPLWKFVTSKNENSFSLSSPTKYSPLDFSRSMTGRAHSGQVELQILQCSALAMATAHSMNISAHSFIAPLGTGCLHHCVARQQKQHLHQKMNKPIRAVRGETLPGWPQDRRGLSGLTQDCG